jgi:hypothetical protein
MEEEKKIEAIENNILNEKAILDNSNKATLGWKDRIKCWCKDPQNLTLAGILVFAFVLRLYYFWITKNQPLWWDESEYMAKAKAIAGLIHYDAASIRSPIFPAFMSIFFFLGIASEPIMRFFGLFIPSILVIILAYFMIKEMYSDKRIALISTLIMAVLWEHLFYSNRFHTENIALIFQFFALFLFFKVYIKNQDFYFIKPKYSLIWIAAFSILSFLFRPGNIMFLPAIFLFGLLLNKDKILTKTGILSISALVIVGLSSIFFSDKLMAFVKTYTHFSEPIGWYSLTVFYGFYQSFVSNLPSILFYVFLIGLAIVIFKTLLILDKVKTFKVNSDDLEFKSDLFNILLLFSVLFVFVFIMRQGAGFEYRWFFPLLPAMLAFTARGTIDISEYLAGLIGKKSFAIILIVLISVLGAYTQVNHADQIIKLKLDSYSQVRDAALWLKENYDKNEKLLSVSYPQSDYYSELNVSTYPPGVENETAFNNYLKSNKPRFLEVSGFEIPPKWLNGWLEHNQNRTIPIKVYFMDAAKTQPILIVYEMNYSS